ncbi:response regulator [Lactiplantibacillus daowaiensis]|uniref:Response regulator n=1 Tax=Lactiplantibacillus daowaiensis TaxID=2559918 RepID=A0ABW1RZU5_9LACO|nr:response regulator [Lactiplantibacillus daowaiensis]
MIKVMLVDDEYMLLRGIQLLIDWTAYGFEIVQTEQNPVKALAYLQDQPIDVLISDMNMPEMAGPEFVTQAKQLQPEMELLVISGYDNFDYVHAGLQQNAVNYLRKPIDTDELIAALADAKQHLADRQLIQHNASLAAQMRVRTLLTTDSATTQTQMLAALNVTFTAATPLRLIGILNPLPPQALVRYLSTQTTVKGYYGEGQDFIILFQGSRSALNQFIEQAPQQIGADRRPFLVGAPIAKPAALATGYTQLKREIARQYFFETAAGLRIMLPENQSVVTPDLPGYSTLKQAIGRVKLPTFETWLTAQFDELKQQNASDTLARQFALIVLLVLADQVTTFNDRERYIEPSGRS